MGVLDGDTDADRLGGVKRGVLFCDASKKLCGARGLTTCMIVRTANARNSRWEEGSCIPSALVSTEFRVPASDNWL